MRFELNRSTATINFTVKQFAGLKTVRGGFKDVSGSVDLATDLAGSHIEAKIPASSIDTGNSKRDEHLRSDDFFSAGTFADLVFVSTAVEPTEQGFTLRGDLTIRDQTHPVSLDVRREGKRLVASGSLNRTEFGISKMPNFLVSHRVGLEFVVEGDG